MRPTFIIAIVAAAVSGASLASAQAPSATPSQPVTAAPAAGANSFTEAQARGRLEAAGFTNVTELQKDDQGVWRGRASRNGTVTAVGVDFRGNVVEGAAPAR
ncbi:hypothetical protein EJV46_01470 [Roseococcus sp. SYP-B2431]|uniref:hypothetical protein n=1 Tax=Roseococcus sp. SYP-B2431 TaxID=2496640 RepID=UPI00103A1B67|nr:hypothetical protein [Roseococcus sp. SYP-B2431]TCH99375.1 hypothetical protein EJV46_01470 [Roseococcus sp. SYP-B2431]